MRMNIKYFEIYTKILTDGKCELKFLRAAMKDPDKHPYPDEVHAIVRAVHAWMGKKDKKVVTRYERKNCTLKIWLND